MKVSNTSERLKEIIKDRGLKQVEIIEKSKPYTEKYGVKLGKNDLRGFHTRVDKWVDIGNCLFRDKFMISFGM